jgi:hypothetical protein
MDLGTVMKKLSDGSYRDLENIVREVHLTFDNALRFNPKNSEVYMLAKHLKKEFDVRYKNKVRTRDTRKHVYMSTMGV